MRIRAALTSETFKASLLRVASTGLGVVAGVVIARASGVEGKGATTTFAALAALIHVVANLDLPGHILREVRRLGSHEFALANLYRAWVWYTPAFLVFGFAVAFSFPSHWIVVVGGLSYLLMMQSSFLASGVLGPMASATASVIQQGVVILLFVGVGLTDVQQNFVIWGLMMSVGFLSPVPWTVWRISRQSEAKVKATLDARSLMRDAARWQPVRMLQFLVLRMDVLAASLLLGSRAVGVYSVSLSLCMIANIWPTQIATATMRNLARGVEVDIRAMARDAIFKGLLGVIFACGILGWLIQFVYGREFALAHPLMLTIAPGVVALGYVQVLADSLRILANWRAVLRWFGFGASIMGVALIGLGNWVGVAGIGVAFSLGALASAGLATWDCRRGGSRDILMLGSS